MDWSRLLQKPENIFNNSFIETTLGKIVSKKLVAKSIKALNKVAKVYKGMVRFR
jgi:hypothetical protein